jgi:hypothetical protein
MKRMRWQKYLGAAALAGATLTGCCIAPFAPYPPPRYGAVYEPTVVVAPVPMLRDWGGWGWRR